MERDSANLQVPSRYQEAFDWRKCTKRGCRHAFVSRLRSFDRAVIVAWYGPSLETRLTQVPCMVQRTKTREDPAAIPSSPPAYHSRSYYGERNFDQAVVISARCRAAGIRVGLIGHVTTLNRQ